MFSCTSDYDPVSFKVCMAIDTVRLKSLVPYGMTMMFIQDHT